MNVTTRLRPRLRWWQFDSVGRRFKLYSGVRINIAVRFEVGSNVTIRRNCVLTGSGCLTIGSGTTINQDVMITAMESVHIGDDCMIAPRTSILDVDHRFSDPHTLIKKQGYTTAPIVIEDDVWIGGGCFILKGVRIGKGAVVAANSVVTQDVAAYQIVAGSPAKMIGERPGA